MSEYAPFTLSEFVAYDLLHRLIINLAFQPADDVQVGESPGFEPAFLKLFDRGIQFFELGSKLTWGEIEIGANKTKHFFFDDREVFHFCHEAVNRPA